jgi:quinol-cytochrome oxidoreductase complex cytochrome b subunit
VKRLLTVTALIETATGLGLILMPSVVVRLLLGSELLGAGISLGRLTGVALLTLGIVCWLASSDTQSCAARGIVTAMTLYNIGAVLILACAGLQSPTVGIGLWPAVILHAAMAVWCVTTLLQKRGRASQILTR